MILFQDSYDHYATADVTTKWTSEVTDNSASSQPTPAIGAYGRNSTNGRRVTTGSIGNGQWSYLTKTLTPSGPTFVGGFSIKPSAGAFSATHLGLLSILDASSPQITLSINNDFTITVTRGASNGTVLGTTTASLSAGVAAHIGLKVTIHPSAGTVDVTINGLSALSLTGQNTRATSNSTWNVIHHGLNVSRTASATGSATYDFDDFYGGDGSGSAPNNDLLGDVRVACSFPSGNGANTGLTPSTGSNHAALVDEAAPNGDTDYNGATTTGAKDTYAMTDLPISGVTVFAVQVVASARKTDAGTSTLAAVTRHAGTDYDAAAQAMSTGYSFLLFMQQSNPATGSLWTETDYNAAEFGVKKVA